MIELVVKVLSKFVDGLYCVRLSVRTFGFQPNKTSSTLVRSTILEYIACLTAKVMVNYKRHRVRIPGTGSVFQYGLCACAPNG